MNNNFAVERKNDLLALIEDVDITFTMYKNAEQKYNYRQYVSFLHIKWNIMILFITDSDKDTRNTLHLSSEPRCKVKYN